MIVFDLECSGGHRFEGWFGSSEDFAQQQERGLLTCPQCGDGDVLKAPMAANLGRKGNQRSEVAAAKPQAMSKGALPPEAAKVMQAMAAMQTEALKSSKWVGESFAEDARAMHYGEREVEQIHGQATAAEARSLLDEGIEVAPLPFPVAPPDETN